MTNLFDYSIGPHDLVTQFSSITRHWLQLGTWLGHSTLLLGLSPQLNVQQLVISLSHKDVTLVLATLFEGFIWQLDLTNQISFSNNLLGHSTQRFDPTYQFAHSVRPP